jgi:DNA-binding transcriptional ArsR family regulator
MTAQPPIYWIETPRELAALASPLRQEIIDAASGAAGTVSIADLAAALGRPPDRLYFHVRLLLRVGLLIPAGSRKQGRHVAALYSLPAPRVRMRYNPADPRISRGITSVVEGVLRLARRDFRRAMRAGARGPLREVWGGRVKGWLTPHQQTRLNQHIERIDALLRSAKRRPGVRPVAFTFVRVPLDLARDAARATHKKESDR